MVHGIYVGSCIQEDPGYLHIAVQRCIMKAGHFLLKGISEETGIRASSQELQLQTIQRYPCFPPAPAPCPRTGKFMEVVSTAP